MSLMDVASLIGLMRSEIHQQSTLNDGSGVSTSSHGTGIPSHSATTTSSMAVPIVSPSLSGMTAWFNSVLFVWRMLDLCWHFARWAAG